MIDWSDLQLILAIHEAGSHAAAARQLGSSQPTISRRLRAIEEKFGQPVFVGSGPSSDLTELGELMVQKARAMEREAAPIARVLKDGDPGVTGKVTLTASEGMGTEWLPAALAPLLNDHPELSIATVLGMSPANLVAGEADIALRWLHPGEQQSLIAQRIATVGVGLYGSERYLIQHGTPSRYEELFEHSGIEWRISVDLLWPVDDNNVPYRPHHVRISASSPSGHLRAIEHGMGLGVTTHGLASTARKPIKRVLPTFENLHDLWLVTNDRVKRNSAQRLVYDYLADAIKRDSKHFRHGAPSIFLKEDTG